MSYNLFPNSNHLQLDTRGGPIMEDREVGPGPMGSWNEDEPPSQLEIDRVYPYPVTAARDLFGQEVLDEATCKELIQEAYPRALKNQNAAITRAVRDGLDLDGFEEASYEYADDLMESHVYNLLRDRGILDVRALTPIGVVKVVDRVMSFNGGTVKQLQQSLVTAYTAYVDSLNEID